VNVTFLSAVFHLKNEPFFSFSYISAESHLCGRPEIDHPLFPFAPHQYFARPEINIFHAQIPGLDQSTPGAVEQLK
jgi:hypothetical protein